MRSKRDTAIAMAILSGNATVIGLILKLSTAYYISGFIFGIAVIVGAYMDARIKEKINKANSKTL